VKLATCITKGSVEFDLFSKADDPEIKHYLSDPDKADAAPLVAAVSPMADAQALDLESSIRRQQELALRIQLALTYSGLNAQADLFGKYARQMQQDAQSRTAMVATNAYSLAGGSFGFQVGPRFTAAPGSIRKPAAYMLDRQSFPTLLIFGMDQDDIRPRVKLIRLNDTQVRCDVLEPQIKLTSSSHWLRMDETIRLGMSDGHVSNYRRLEAQELYRVLGSAEQLLEDARSLDLSNGGKKPPVKSVQGELEKLKSESGSSFDLFNYGNSLWLMKMQNKNNTFTAKDRVAIEQTVRSVLMTQGAGLVRLAPCHLPEAGKTPPDGPPNADSSQPKASGDQSPKEELPDPNVCASTMNPAKVNGIWIRIENSLIERMERRYEMLAARLSERPNRIPLPLDVVVPPEEPKAKPAVEQIIPEAVELKSDANGKAVSQKVQLLITGKELGKVNVKEVKLVMGKLQGKNPGDPIEAKLMGSALMLSFEVVSAEQPVVFSLSIDKDSVITTKPFIVRQETSMVRFEHTTESQGARGDKGETKTERYSFPAGLSENVVKSEIEKSKPSAPASACNGTNGQKQPCQ